MGVGGWDLTSEGVVTAMRDGVESMTRDFFDR